MKYTDIDHKVSYYMDYAKEWIYTPERLQDFDDLDGSLIPTQSLLVFTDGSVDTNYSGFGICMFEPANYRLLRKLYNPDDLVDLLSPEETNGFRIDYYMATPLTARGSIDFCEAMAIRDAIFHIAQAYRNTYLKFRKPPDLLIDIK